MTASQTLIRLAALVAGLAIAVTPASAIARRDTTATRTTPDLSCTTPYSPPFAVGEQLKYSVKFGLLKAGDGIVEVVRTLDDGSFFFFVRTQELVVGETYEYPQYFKPDRNPVVVRVIGRDRITVPAGTFETIVLQPMIKTKGIFSEKGEARIWLTDDASRAMVKMTAKVAFGTLTMSLTSARPGADHVIAQGQ